jgi:hypothetical protein
MEEFLSIKEFDMIDVHLDMNSLDRLNLHINRKNPHITPVKIFSINKKYLGSLDVSKDGKTELNIIHIDNIFDNSDSHPIDIYEGSNFIFVEDRGTNNFMVTFHIL